MLFTFLFQFPLDAWEDHQLSLRPSAAFITEDNQHYLSRRQVLQPIIQLKLETFLPWMGHKSAMFWIGRPRRVFLHQRKNLLLRSTVGMTTTLDHVFGDVWLVIRKKSKEFR